MRTRTHYRSKKTKNNKTKKGGKTFGSSKPVKLNYGNKNIVCSVCGNNDYTETTGAFEKSKVRSGVGQAIFGEAAEILDTTSVLIYICNKCGLCKIIRNKGTPKITTSSID